MYRKNEYSRTYANLQKFDKLVQGLNLPVSHTTVNSDRCSLTSMLVFPGPSSRPGQSEAITRKIRIISMKLALFSEQGDFYELTRLRGL